jgi:transposase
LAFFTNLGQAIPAKNALRQIYSDALKTGTIRQTLAAMRGAGLSRETYNRYLQRAKDDGLIDPANKITPSEIVEAIRPGNGWFGIGP